MASLLFLHSIESTTPGVRQWLPAKGRVVGLSTIHFRGEKQVGHAVQFVEADGYWHGGAFDEETGGGCQIC